MDYVVRDRSVLLPLYKRFVVDPLLPAIPRRVHPNLITHVGHLVNALGVAVLVASHARPAWTYLAAIAAVQVYVFCDNADGGHARRTKQCSPGGELLDHGLDLLNVTYIAIVAALALGATAAWTAAIVIVLPGRMRAHLLGAGRDRSLLARCAEPGRIGDGALRACSLAPRSSASMSGRASASVHCRRERRRRRSSSARRSSVSCGISRGFGAGAGASALANGVPLVAFGGTLFAGVVRGALPGPAAIVAATAASIFFGVRCLARRAGGERSAREPGLLVAVMLAIAYVIVRPGAAGYGALAAVAFFGAYAVANARAAYDFTSSNQGATR